MEKQKQVHITGLTLNKSLGIIQAHKLIFDSNNKLIIFKGGVGEGKTTEQKVIQIGIHGTKAMIDNQKYGEIDLELQLTDGDLPFFVGRKSKGKKILSTLYIKDENGKIVENPIIDGNKAKPSTYFKQLETKLTWRMSELTSDNPNVQKKILLELYQSQLSKLGVIFDKKHLDYSLSILGQIDKAVTNRDNCDFARKQIGGIADDLKAKGHDPDRPETCPETIPIESIETEIKRLEKEKILATAEPEAQKDKELAEIKADAAIITGQCVSYNSELRVKRNASISNYKEYITKIETIKSNITALTTYLEVLGLKHHFETLNKDIVWPDELNKPTEPNYIQFDADNKVQDNNVKLLHIDGKALIDKINQLKQQYINVFSKESNIDTSKFDTQIEQQEKNKKDALEINKIVDAIDSFHKWRAANEEVVFLKDKYIKLLSQVDTGVKGLHIEPIEDDIFLMYNGSYDTKYFNNPELEMRKLSSYSGTQKPMICLLIQNYLLSLKPKAMRYLYIDDIPIDKKTRLLLEKMTEDLNMHIFLNITGDFEQSQLQKGEILISGGEVLFPNTMPLTIEEKVERVIKGE